MYEFKKSFFNNKSYLVFQSAAEGVLACSMKRGYFSWMRNFSLWLFVVSCRLNES